MPEPAIPPDQGPASPCTGQCRLDAPRQHCLGCGRSLAEIAAWPKAGLATRQAILAALASRRRSDGA